LNEEQDLKQTQKEVKHEDEKIVNFYERAVAFHCPSVGS
jgi:hypothetical protein